jgi:hypothetical protein
MVEQSSIKFVAGALALLLLVPALGTNMQAADAAPATGIMVPLYTYPGGTWDTVIETKNDHPDVPIVTIVNPASGPGGSQDSNYVSGINELRDAGVIVLGYVSTAYTGRSLSAVKADIDRWDSWYDVDGIFFDEQTNWSGGESYYTQAGDYAESKGLDFTVGNPGANSIPSYLSTVDVVLIYESPGLPNLDNYASWESYDNGQLGMIPFGVSSLPTGWLQDATAFIGWVYVTSDTLPNPWDSLPSYFDDMAALLDDGSSSSPPPEPVQEHQLTVRSVDQTGKAINGMWVEVKKDGVSVRTGFTPLSLTLKEGTYTVSAGNYQLIIFDHWQDGSKSSTISVNLSADTTLTANYNNGAIAVTPLSVTLKADRTTATAGTSISFSSTIQGGTTPYTWSVSFGDGTSSPFTSASSVSKTYDKAGTYSAVATAKDAAGRTATSVSVTITVTQGTNTLTVNTANAAGSPINGYYTTLSQNGVVIKTAFSPASFTLNSGQTYQVSVSDYGSYVFDHWNDGSTSRQKTVTGGQTTTLTAYYRTAGSPTPEPEPEETTLIVKSVDLNGKAITGLWTVIKKDGSTVKTGYTPLSYTAQAGSTYEVSVSNYQSYVFDHWESGSKSSTRQVTVNSDTTLTAYYSTGSTKVTITIKTVGLDGKEITGLWTVISGAGSATGFSPLSYTATIGSQYTVTMGEYLNYKFDHWDNGSTSKSRTITPSSNTVLTAYYRQ